MLIQAEPIQAAGTIIAGQVGIIITMEWDHINTQMENVLILAHV